MKWMNLFSVNPAPSGPTYSGGYQQTRWDQTVKVDNGLYQALFLAVNLHPPSALQKQKTRQNCHRICEGTSSMIMG